MKMLSFKAHLQKLNRLDRRNFMPDIFHLFIALFKNLKNHISLTVLLINSNL